MESSCTVNIVFLLLAVISVRGLYLSTDYYMDQGHQRAFGGVCSQPVTDLSAFINTHVNKLKMTKYGSDRDCWMVLDAGEERNASYVIRVMKWELEPAELKTGRCLHDYLQLYNASGLTNGSLIASLCGFKWPNLTSLHLGRYLTLRFVTDHHNSHKGFRLLAVRTTPAPCQDDEFSCEAEKRCIGEKLVCDGTKQCQDGLDEKYCNSMERAVGWLLSLGVGGLVGVGCAVFMVCMISCTLFSYACCKSKPNERTRLRKQGSTRRRSGTRMPLSQSQSEGSSNRHSKGSRHNEFISVSDLHASSTALSTAGLVNSPGEVNGHHNQACVANDTLSDYIDYLDRGIIQGYQT